jgi:hypothetical protein
MLRITILLSAVLAAGAVSADEAASKQAAKPPPTTTSADKPAASDAKSTAASAQDAKTLSGISILGNQEAPKSLVIVPWKGSEIGDMPALSRLLDDSVQPVDKDVFMRELSYYEIRSGEVQSGKE